MKTCPHIYLCPCNSWGKKEHKFPVWRPFYQDPPAKRCSIKHLKSQASPECLSEDNQPPSPQKRKWMLLNRLIQLILLHFWVLNVAFISFQTWPIQLLTVGHLICSDGHLIVFWSCLSTKETLKVRLGPKINQISLKVKQVNANYRAACWGTNWSLSLHLWCCKRSSLNIEPGEALQQLIFDYTESQQEQNESICVLVQIVN